jgi:5'-nucleotidase
MTQPLRSIIAALALTALASQAAAQSPAPVELRILAINDFHGNLKPPTGGIRIDDAGDKGKKVIVPAGGAEQMATLLKQLREGHTNNVFVAAGDLIGASPFLSAMFHDEPTIESLSLMGLGLSAVGNHEFDEGKDELLRMQNGGCHKEDGCKGPHPFEGAKFHYLAASTFPKDSGKTLFPPYEIRTFDGIPVAFIGLTLKGTPDIISPAAAAGLEFRDEADTVNALVPELKAKGVEAIVVLIHEGGYPTGDYNECPAISGAIVDIVKKFDKAIDVVISGHTHQAYVCEIDGRLVTSADKFGTLVTAIDLKLDPVTRDVISAKADNTIVRTSLARDPEQTALIDSYEKVAAPIANRRAGTITATLSRAPNLTGESVLGDVVADAQLAATRSEANGGAGDGLHQSRRHPHRHRDERRRRRQLRGNVRRATVPQPPGHADADGRADQGDAGAAMARSGAPAHPAGLRRIFLRMGCGKAIWRACRSRLDEAERRRRRAGEELPRHRQRLSRARRRWFHRAEGRRRAAIWHL